MIPKRYLGDGVYAAVERGMIKLTTEDGIAETNTIYLEPGVYVELDRFWRDAVAAAVAEAAALPETDDGTPA